MRLGPLDAAGQTGACLCSPYSDRQDLSSLHWAGQVGAWSNCSAACGTGAASRPVACLSGATGAPARDEGACGARARPPAAQPCAGPAGATCGAQPGGAACSSHGVRPSVRCQCDAGYRGLFCELPAACDGFPDSSGDCCMTVVDRCVPPPGLPRVTAKDRVRSRMRSRCECLQ